MNAPQPAADKVNDLLKEVEVLFGSAKRFYSQNHLYIRRLFKEAENMKNVSQTWSWIFRASIHGVVGEHDESMRLLDLADRLGDLDRTWYLQTHFSLNNKLLYASIAQKKCSEYTGFVHLHLHRAVEHLIFCGAFQKIEQVMERIHKANLSIRSPEFAQLGRSAAYLLGKLGVTDEQCAQVLDAAGTVLRERGLIWMNARPNLIIDQEMQTVGMHYKVDVGYDEATDMFCELSEKLREQDLLNLPFIVAFEGVAK